MGQRLVDQLIILRGGILNPAGNIASYPFYISMQILVGFLLAVIIAGIAWRVGSLSISGAWAAVITGGLIFGLGGLPWAILLLGFFISSSALSRAFRKRKIGLADKYSKGERRDWGQVIANGALGGLLAIGFFFAPRFIWLWLGFAGAMAAVNADTWSTELGILSPTSPRMITNGKSVEPGTSGGITLVGTMAALGGAILIAMLAAIFSPSPDWMARMGCIILGGLAGSLTDSALGATVQAIYWCPVCGKETERHPLHSCGSPTNLIRGWSWVNNDLVNFACSLAGAIITAGAWLIFLSGK